MAQSSEIQGEQMSALGSERNDGLGRRIYLVRRRARLSREPFAKRIGISAMSLRRYESGDRTPDADTVNAIGEAFDVSVQWLMTGAGIPPSDLPADEDEDRSSPPEVSANARRLAMRGSDVVWIPMYSAQPRAGVGASDHEWLEDALPMRADDIRSLDVDATKLAVVTVQGDSMQPTLRAGDTVLVDTRTDQPNRDGIHVLRLGDALMVKRIQWQPDGSVRIVSDNEAYEPIVVSGEKIEGLNIVGRVLRAWKDL